MRGEQERGTQAGGEETPGWTGLSWAARLSTAEAEAETEAVAQGGMHAQTAMGRPGPVCKWWSGPGDRGLGLPTLVRLVPSSPRPLWPPHKHLHDAWPPAPEVRPTVGRLHAGICMDQMPWGPESVRGVGAAAAVPDATRCRVRLSRSLSLSLSCGGMYTPWPALPGQ